VIEPHYYGVFKKARKQTPLAKNLIRKSLTDRSFIEWRSGETGALCPGVGSPVRPHPLYVVSAAAEKTSTYSACGGSGAGQGGFGLIGVLPNAWRA